MVTTPAVENAVAWFGAHTVTHRLDVVVVVVVDRAVLQRERVRVYDAEVR